jgi:hypothetical protein
LAEAFEARDEPAHAQDEGDDCDGGDAGSRVGVMRREPSEGDSADVFAGREGDVGERLRAGGHESAGGSLGGVGNGCDGGTGGCGEELHLRGELVSGLIGEKCGDWDADERVGGVPDEIEGGDFVGEELDREEEAGYGDDPWVGEGVKTGRKDDPMDASEDAEGGNGGIDVEAGGEAGSNDERGDGGGREGHGSLRRCCVGLVGMVSQTTRRVR